MFYRLIIRPFLFLVAPETIHNFVIRGLGLVSRLPGVAQLITRFCRINNPALETDLAGLKLINPVGLSAGFDKYIEAPLAYPMLGFGFAELGSITYQAQQGNLKPRLWRLPADQGLIVHYGLNNHGAVSTAEKIKRWSRRAVPYGISIAVSTECGVGQMVDDYLASLRVLAPLADYITLNVSCPNVATQATVKQLGFITALMTAVQAEKKAGGWSLPIFIKIGADFPRAELNELLGATLAAGLTGVVATNLVKDRSVLKNIKSPADELDHPGGISGRLISDLSTEMIRHIYRYTQGKLVIVGVGGVFTAADAYAKIRAGASAVQIITGFIYGGPLVVRRINRGLIKLLAQDGYDNIRAAVGADVQ